MKIRVAILSLSSLFAFDILHASDEVAGFQRVTGLPADDNLDWSDTNRFQGVSLEAFIADTATVSSVSGSTLTTEGTFWRVEEFKYIDGDQPRHYVIEITSGTEAGSKFDIISNLGNSVTVDLNGGSLANVVPGDTFQVIAKWSLNQLFPNGNGITPSTSSFKGSEILLPDSVPGSVDFSSSPTYQYRSDLNRWIEVSDDSTDVGDQPFMLGELVVIRQTALTTIQPVVAGFPSSGTPLNLTVSYLQEGLDLFSNALSISEDGARAVNTNGATGEVDEPQHGGNATTASVWFKYTASQSGTLLVRSQHSNFDTVLAAYTGTSLNTLIEITSNDDVSADTWSEISVPILNGESCYIALDGNAGATGEGFISWELRPGAPEITIEYPSGTSLTDGSAAINFGNVEATTIEEITMTITNTGSALLSGLAASLSGSGAASFTASTPPNTILAPGQSTTFTVHFQPGTNGGQSATLQIASNDADENPFDISLTGTGITQITLSSWGSGHSLSGNGLLPTADEDDDSIGLLAEYAFNMNPNASDLSRVAPGTGTSGLPDTRMESERLVVEFIRRSSETEITAKAVFSDSPLGPWVESSMDEVITPIDDYYERVVIPDVFTLSSKSQRFAKVIVEMVSP